MYAAFNKMNELRQQGDIVRAPLGQRQIIKCTKLRPLGQIKQDPNSTTYRVLLKQITALRQKISRFLKVKVCKLYSEYSYVSADRMNLGQAEADLSIEICVILQTSQFE